MKTKSASLAIEMLQFLFASLVIGFIASLSLGAIVLMLSADVDATQATAVKPTSSISSSHSSQ